jgi:mono/diheme cytochrome c family protein
MIARGRYLVDTIGICGECHTPRLASGMKDPARYLAGVECLRTEGGGDERGCLHSANLTDHETGLRSYTDDQIKAMFTTGKRPDGRNLHPLMPYWVFRNMTSDDADSIVAYLRTVPGVDRRAAERSAVGRRPRTGAADRSGDDPSEP